MIRLQNLTTSFYDAKHRTVNKALNQVSLEIPEGIIFTLLGPSGCGKTTTLRSIAGLEKPNEGEIWFGDDIVFSSKKHIFSPPEKRKVGMVFQSYAIWPHMTVADNVAYPLVAERMKKEEIKQRVSEALQLVGLEKMADRPTPKLSGGQQQRVALARALVSRPRVLLFDEPLSNLDAKLREQMRLEIRNLQRKTGITTIYVTHDQEEALSLSDYIAVFNNGNIEQIAKPFELYQKPENHFVADFVGLANFMKAKALNLQVERHTLVADTAIGHIHINNIEEEVLRTIKTGDEFELFFRPEHVSVLNGRGTDGLSNVIEARVDKVTYLGQFSDIWLEAGSNLLRGRLMGSIQREKGDHLTVHVEPENIRVLTK